MEREKPQPEDETMSGKKISDIEPVEESVHYIRQREELEALVEAPLLSACQELYDKNIKTVFSSANRKDIEDGKAYIVIDFPSLSEENKRIAERVGTVEGDTVRIEIEIDENTTVDDVRRKAETTVQQFEWQTMTWVRTYTIEELRYAYSLGPSDGGLIVQDFIDEGYYYDKGSGLFYDNEEQYRKAARKEQEQ